MAYAFIITANRNRDIEQVLTFEGAVEKVTVDYSPWVEDNATVTAVTVTVESGDASVGGASLASNVWTGYITTTNQGASLIKLKATAGSITHVTHLEVRAKDPEYPSQDYGLCRG